MIHGLMIPDGLFRIVSVELRTVLDNQQRAVHEYAMELLGEGGCRYSFGGPLTLHMERQIFRAISKDRAMVTVRSGRILDPRGYAPPGALH